MKTKHSVTFITFIAIAVVLAACASTSTNQKLTYQQASMTATALSYAADSVINQSDKEQRIYILGWQEDPPAYYYTSNGLHWLNGRDSSPDCEGFSGDVDIVISEKGEVYILHERKYAVQASWQSNTPAERFLPIKDLDCEIDPD